MNDLQSLAHMGAQIVPWQGKIPFGFDIDFLGVRTRMKFGKWIKRRDGYIETQLPTPESAAEGWFEFVDWVASVEAARDRFVAISLGACWGYQLVRAHRVLQMLNPMPCKLVAVEPNEAQCAWIRQHMADNGIDPNEHWIIHAAVHSNNEPVFFPFGEDGSGSENCVATNDLGERRLLAERICDAGQSARVVKQIFLRNRTGPLGDVRDNAPELRLVSAVTIADVLAPFERVDFLESDIQESEIIAFPPAIDILSRKVRRVHLGTHGAQWHAELHELFEQRGWEIVFSYSPGEEIQPGLKPNDGDGILTVVNPSL